MRLLLRTFCLCWMSAACVGPSADAQTSLTGNSLAFRSTGSSLIASTGYVGTYLTVPDSGDGGSVIDLNVNATRGIGTGDPHLNIVVADSKFGFAVTADDEQSYSSGNLWLPAGTHFVRVERDSPGNLSPGLDRPLTINSLTVSGGSFSNNNSRTNALNAANTYVEHFRKGSATIHLSGVPSGTSVEVRQVGHEFNFGAAVAGTSLSGVNSVLNNANYRNRLLENFNMVVPENAGKWESSVPPFGIQAMDAILQFAESNGLESRMHNLIWGSQQPGFVNTLISQAQAGSSTAKTQLRQAISDRIDYYVGDRATRYTELDVLNEALRSPAYWNIFTPAEIAGIYAEVRDAAAAAGATVGLYANDYNILQHNSNPLTSQPDSYANWHRNHIEELNSQGFGDVVSGVGIQYYVRDDGSVSVPRIQQVFQNMGVTGLPLTLTEFGIQTVGSPSPTESAGFLEDTMRMMFGTPHATTFIMWGFWQGAIWDQAPNAALYDTNWNLTEVGERYRQLMDEWTTEAMLTVSPDGAIAFDGFYGEYEITIDGVVYPYSHVKGDSTDTIVVAPGDYNTDGIVDSADYVLWRKAIDTPFWADGDGSGLVDDEDLAVWRARYGKTFDAGAGQHHLVPEPASLVLNLIACLAPLKILSRRRPLQSPRRTPALA